MTDQQQPQYKLNSLVKIDHLNLQGYLKFQGSTHFKQGHWLGLELLPIYHGKGKNDGSIDGTRYFTCKQGNGIFIQLNKVTQVVQPTLRIPSTPRSSMGSHSAQSTPKPRHSLSRLKSVDNMPPPSSPPTLTRTRLNSLSNTSTPHKRSVSVTSNRTPSQQSIDRPASTISQRTPSRQSLSHRKSYSRGLQPDDVLSDELASLKEKHAAQLSQLTDLQSSHSNTSSQLQNTSTQLQNTSTQLQDALAAINDKANKMKLSEEEHAKLLSDLKHAHTQDIHTHQSRITELEDDIADVSATLANTQADLESVAHSKDEEIHTLTSSIADLDKRVAQLSTQKDDLEGLVSELRQAGQETIALYEERLNATEACKYESDERIKALEAQYASLLTESHPSSPGTAARRQTTAAEIDNESLKEQLAHLNAKLSGSEEAYSELDRERESATTDAQKQTQKLQQEIRHLHAQLAEVGSELEVSQASCSTGTTKVQELEDALASTKELLEAARAHAETLQSDLDNFENLEVDEEGNERVNELYKRLEREQLQHAEQVADVEKEMDTLHERLKDAENVIDVSKREGDFLRQELSRRSEKESPVKMSDEVATLKNRVRELMGELERVSENGHAHQSLSNGSLGNDDVGSLQEQLKQSEGRRKEAESKVGNVVGATALTHCHTNSLVMTSMSSNHSSKLGYLRR